MAETLTIVARIEAAPGIADRLEAEMKVLVADTRREPGCLRYDLHRDTKITDVFVFVEEWQSMALWQTHMSGAAIRDFNTRIGDGMISSGEIMELRQVA